MSLLIAGVAVVAGAGAGAQEVDFTKLSIDQLLHIKIVSVSKKPETLLDSAAAVYVMTGEDVARSGADSLGTALRMVPGMQAAQIDNANMAIAARGFNDVSSNKLLVLIDGRSVYSPLFSGVVWSSHEFILQDLDRIEAIRGPGATLWGSNAVNGVVNITSRSATETTGTLLSASYGDWLRHVVSVRHGWMLNDVTGARVYAKSSRRGPALDLMGDEVDRDRRNELVGFRVDREGSGGASLTVQGDWRRRTGDNDATLYSIFPPYVSRIAFKSDNYDANLLARYRAPWGSDGEVSAQVYYNYLRNERADMLEVRHVGDFDGQVLKRFGERHEVVAGVGVRVDRDKLTAGSAFVFTPPRMTSRLMSVFVQDEIALLPERAVLTVGAKLEDGDRFDTELQPNLRLLLRPARDHSVWFSAARAARTPSRGERTARLIPMVVPPNPMSPLPTQVVIDTDPEYDSEHLTALEAGWRWSVGSRLSFDVAVFHNRYSGLRSVEPIGTSVEFTPVPHVQFLSRSGNGLRGDTVGGEVLVNWQPISPWRLQATFSALDYDLELAPGGADVGSLQAIPGSSPSSQFGLRSFLRIREGVTFDCFMLHVGRLEAYDVPAYTGLDARLGWEPRPGVELSLVGRHLLDDAHPEFPPTFLGGEIRQVARNFSVQVELRF
jgi:iron complex outermembrane receptor protein